ncbi:hypothetical protein VTK73DRAFT_1533 [Phialemonium thermophilum]|uniref:Uncharacterized protein n=1 Tax=Phialemonium thermophilum TaxID=223376 RepID=A0ABR3VTC1_9PEZI
MAPTTGQQDELKNQESYAGTAPTYVNAQYMRDKGGPHGKNLKEGGFEGEGPGDSINAEPGSEQDPARVAERDMNLSQTKAGRDAGPRQPGAAGEGHPYDALDETSA